MLRKIGRGLLWVIAAILGLIIIILILAVVFYPPQYVYRLLAYGESDVGDFMNNFPMRRIGASSNLLIFEEKLDEERVRDAFEGVIGVEDFDAYLDGTETQAFIVIQDDGILYEEYFNGSQRDSLVTSYSVAKSFTSALIGLALEEGYINSVNDPITDYLPELAERDPRFEAITIRNLLMMAGGIGFQEMRPLILNGDDPLATYYPDQRKAALEFTEITDQPGNYFLYNKYYPQLLGMIIERSTGMSVSQFMEQELWQPMGAEYDAAWSLDSEKSGFEKMEAGVNARAIDFVRFGRLFLENGSRDGKQIIPAEWVIESTQVDEATLTDPYYASEMGQIIKNDLNGYYKYMWYGFFQGDGAFDFAAVGDHGQFIYVSPAKRLIIVRNGYEYGEGMSWHDWVAYFKQFSAEF